MAHADRNTRILQGHNYGHFGLFECHAHLNNRGPAPYGITHAFKCCADWEVETCNPF